MNFDKLNAYIPYVKGGKLHSLSMQIYPGVDLAMPGKHADESGGGDGVVLISDDALGWVKHPFTHVDIFQDVELKRNADPGEVQALMNLYLGVVKGKEPTLNLERFDSLGIHRQTFLYATQVLSVIEHRRYKQYENKFGGRFLPARFAFGIAEGLWTAADAAEKQKKGRPGVEWLEKDFGVPVYTSQLMGLTQPIRRGKVST